MPLDPVRVAEVRAWFAKAAQDRRAAEHELTAEPPLVEDVVFHCQQLAEKAMKGFLVWHDEAFRKTHDLSEIGQKCTDLDLTLEDLCREADALTVFAWVFRYPADAEAPTVDEARSALALDICQVQLRDGRSKFLQ